MSLAGPVMLLAALQSTGPVQATDPHASVPTVQARRVTGSISIDGRLDEPDWRAAVPATEFIQTDPNEGEPASEPTELRILIDDHSIYIGARMFDSDPAAIKAILARRDAPVSADMIEFFIDAYHDHLSAVRFRITAGGAIRDAVQGSSGGSDASWDPVWDYATRIDSLGWTAELRIPLSQLRYNSEDDAVWGIQAGRLIFRKGEIAWLNYIPKTETFGVNRFAHIVGLGRVEPQRQLEVMPYSLGRGEFRDVASDNPFRDGSDLFGEAGLDLKYGITSDLTLDASFNPDFGQVEVDPAVVNLSAFETFFPEKRPFFVEGADVFRFGSIRSFNSTGFPTFFFSRRIGRQPQLGVGGPDVNFPDTPTQTTILGATKLSGRTAGGWSIGMIEALTAEEEARYLDGAGVRQTAPVEPLTNYFVGRVRREFRSGNNTVGAMVTAVNRRLSAARFQPVLRSDAYMGGIDFANSWANRMWSFDGAIAFSHVRGSAEAIGRTQLSSARYFQRPDQDEVRFDPARTSLSGYAYQLSLSKNSGRHWIGSLTYQEVSPEFEVNDLGFETSAGRRGLSWLGGYQETRPGKIFRSVRVLPFANLIWNSDGDLLFQGYATLASGTFTNFWSWFVRFDVLPEVNDDRLTRGGPLARRPSQMDVVGSLSTDSRSTTRLSGDFFYRWDVEDGFTGSYGLSLSLRPTAAASISIGPRFDRSRTVAQYVQTVPDPIASTFGARYVFARLDRTEVSMVARIEWTFTPRLSLQLYLQPLISAVNFGGPKELEAARTFDFVEYGVDRGAVVESGGGVTVTPGDGGADFFVAERDFNFRSLRGNAVLRWEYRPGSTIFLIWQQNRQDFRVGVSDFSFGRDFDALLGAPSENVVAVKLSYWLGI